MAHIYYNTMYKWRRIIALSKRGRKNTSYFLYDIFTEMQYQYANERTVGDLVDGFLKGAKNCDAEHQDILDEIAKEECEYNRDEPENWRAWRVEGFTLKEVRAIRKCFKKMYALLGVTPGTPIDDWVKAWNDSPYNIWEKTFAIWRN